MAYLFHGLRPVTFLTFLDGMNRRALEPYGLEIDLSRDIRWLVIFPDLIRRSFEHNARQLAVPSS